MPADSPLLKPPGSYRGFLIDIIGISIRAAGLIFGRVMAGLGVLGHPGPDVPAALFVFGRGRHH